MLSLYMVIILSNLSCDWQSALCNKSYIVLLGVCSHYRLVYVTWSTPVCRSLCLISYKVQNKQAFVTLIVL